ncbi:metallophosphoesterase [Spirosoma areae]
MKNSIYLSCIMLVLGTNARLLAQTPQPILNSGDPWKYWASTVAPSSENWKGAGAFDDSAWPSGASPLGYSPGRVDGEVTIVPTGCGPNVFNCDGTNNNVKFPAICFRKTFTIANINDYRKLILQYRRDDGIVVYVNGVEVRREFMPSGVIAHATSATAGPASTAEEEAWQPIDPDVATHNVPLHLYLRTGVNVIAAEVHQTNTGSPTTNSTDLRFDLKLEGVLPVATSPASGTFGSGSAWKYWAAPTAPSSSNWKGGGTFDDSAWPSGASPLGYAPNSTADGAATIVPTGCGTAFNCPEKFPTICFRKTFTIANINDYQKFIIQYKRDDGIVIYVNGAEVRREFMPDGVITHATSATAGPPNDTEEDTWQLISSDVSTHNVTPRMFLHTGVNVIAAEVHQTNTGSPTTNSTDLRFDLKLEGVLAAAPQHKILRGPYLQMGTTSRMTIRWSTEALSKGQIRYDTIATNLTVNNPQAQLATEPALVSDHQVMLTNLVPNKKYYYVVEVAGPPVMQLEGSATAASLHYFYTAPLPGTAKKTRIWALGDFGTNNSRQDSVIASFKAYKQQQAIDYVDLWLWMGDNAYDWGLDEQYRDNVFKKTLNGIDGRYDWMFRQTPFYAAPGNHDYQNNVLGGGLRYEPHPIHYYDIVNNFTEAPDGGGGVPSHREEYYSFNYNNIHIVSLDSYGFESGQGTQIFAANGPQVTWLKQDLAAAQVNPAINWIIVYWHHAPYTRGSYNSDTEPELMNIRNNFLPILEQYKVDLVMTGHSHVYERSRLMKGNYGPSVEAPTDTFKINVHNPFLAGNAQSSGKYDESANSCFYYKSSASTKNEGIIYVVNGAGGRAGAQAFGAGFHKAMQHSVNEGGSMYVEITGKRLDAKFIAGTGTVKDKFTIIKDSDGFAVPPTDGASRLAVCECTDTAKGFTHYADKSGNLLLSIKKQGYNIGTVGVAPFDLQLKGNAGVTRIDAYSPTNYVRLASYGYRNVTAPWIIFNRYWTLTPGTELSGNNQVIVRQYYKEADLTALNVPYADDPMTHGNLKLYKVNDGTTAYNLDPAVRHTTIPQAPAYNRPGAWVYDARVHGTRGKYPTTHYWLGGDMGKGNYYGDYVVGRLKGGGGIGAPSNFLSNPTGQVDRAPQLWFYLVTNTPPPDWQRSYDLTGWTASRDTGIYVPIGYSPRGEDGEVTRVPNGCPTPNDFNPDCQSKNITTYLKSYGSGPSTGSGGYFQSYILNYRRNDGVIIYLNGQEVLPRDPNMPAPPIVITPATLAALNTNEQEWRTVIIPATTFSAGGVIAAEVHQSSQSSPDMHFNIELIGSPDAATTPVGLREAAPVNADDPSLILLYPNPVEKGSVFFSPALNYQTLRLTDLQGKTYRYLSQPGTIDHLDVSSLPAGIYILTSQGADTRTRYKIVKL